MQLCLIPRFSERERGFVIFDMQITIAGQQMKYLLEIVTS